LAVSERGRWRGEVVAYCKDGSSVSVELITVALRDAQGQISGYLGIHRDISERRRAAAALREADLRNRNVLESITDDFFAFDEHWGYVYVNDRALQSINNALATNFTRDDLAGKSVWDLFPGFADDPLYAEQEAALREGRPVHVEHYLAVDDRWMDVHAYPCNGGLTIFTHDITDRKRAQEALRAAQHHRETVLESISEEFFAVDREWRYTYVNERALAQARKVAGRDFTAEEMLGMTLWELFPQVRGTRFERELHRAMREQTIVKFEVHSELTGRWLEVRLHPTEVGLAGYTHDISDRKAAQEEIGRRAKQQALIADLGLKALGSEDLQLLFDEAVGVVARTLDVELASVAEMSAGSEEVILRAGVGWDVDAGRRIEPGALAQAHGVVSALSVMIAGPDEPFGALRALSTSRRTFSPSDVSVLQSVANVLAGAVELTRARKRLDQVRRAERSRIARDLHDDALQELTGALVQAEGGRSEGLGAQHVGQLGSRLKRVGEQLRGAIYDLRLEDQEERGFAQLLEGLVALHRAMAVDSQVELDAEDGVPSTPLGRRGTEILRLIGEALTNARRHSHAASIRVSARGSREHLCIEVIDDGRGFDAGADPGSASGTGILGMHERAALLDADLDITSRPGRGTTVRLEVALGAALPGERRTGGP
jgi:PAS domain S-box-containing protein